MRNTSSFSSRSLPFLWTALVVTLCLRQILIRAPESIAVFGQAAELTRAFWTHWTSAFAGAFWTAVLGLAAFSAGRLALAWCGGLKCFGVPEHTPVRLLFGSGLVAMLAVSAGLCGLLFTSLARIGILFAAFSALPAVLRTFRSFTPAAPSPGTAPVKWIALLLFAVLGVFSLTPETWIDSLDYHLAAPADFIREHKIVDRVQVSYRFPLLAESLLGQGLLLGGEKAAVLVNLGGATAMCWLVFGCAAALAGPLAGWIAVIAILASNQVAFHIGNANEGFYSMSFAFLAVRTWWLSLNRRGPLGVLAGVALGWALCSKYPAGAPAAGILLWHLPGAFRDFRRHLGKLAALLGGGAAACFIFFVKSWSLTGNPFYPFLFDGLNWSVENMAVLFAYGCPGVDIALAEPSTVLRTAFRFLTEEQPLFLVALPLVLAGVQRPLAPFVIAWSGAFVLWAFISPCLRFMLPGFTATALLAGMALGRALAPSRRNILLCVAAGTAALSGIIQGPAALDHHRRSSMAASGLEPPERYLKRVLTTYHEAVRKTSELVPPDSKVIVLGESRGYRFGPAALNRSVQDTPTMLEIARDASSPRRIGIRLHQAGVSHVLLNYVRSEYLARYLTREFNWRPSELRRHNTFWRRHADLVWMSAEPDGANGGFALYRLRRHPRVATGLMPFLPDTEYLAARQSPAEDRELTERLLTLVECCPGVIFFRVRLAARLLSAGRPQRTLALIDPCLDSAYPERAVLLGLKGAALSRLGQYREALAALRAAESLEPNVAQIRQLREEAEAALANAR